MRQHQSHFEIIKRTEITALLKDSHRPRILSLTYDPSLARTRELLFSAAGFEVATFHDVEEAIAVCGSDSFDLVVVGHTIPLAERKALVRELRRQCGTPVLAMQRHGEARLLEADYFFDSLESPELLLETVIDILRPHGTQD